MLSDHETLPHHQRTELRPIGIPIEYVLVLQSSFVLKPGSQSINQDRWIALPKPSASCGLLELQIIPMDRSSQGVKHGAAYSLPRGFSVITKKVAEWKRDAGT